MRLWLDWFRHSSYKAAQTGSNPVGRTIFNMRCNNRIHARLAQLDSASPF